MVTSRNWTSLEFSRSPYDPIAPCQRQGRMWKPFQSFCKSTFLQGVQTDSVP